MKSEQIGDLAKALAAAQGAIKGAIKSKENPYFRFHYADLAAIMDACREALSKNGIAIVQTTDFSVSPEDVLGPVAWIETTLIHSSDQWISGRYPVRPVKDDPQGLGSAITYARRYALAAITGVVADNDDDDGEAASGRGGGEVPPKDITRPTPKPKEKSEGAKEHDQKAMQAAIKFAQDACVELEKLTLKKQLTAWLSTNQPKVDKLKSYDTELFELVEATVIETRGRVK